MIYFKLNARAHNDLLLDTQHFQHHHSIYSLYLLFTLYLFSVRLAHLQVNIKSRFFCTISNPLLFCLPTYTWFERPSSSYLFMEMLCTDVFVEVPLNALMLKTLKSDSYIPVPVLFIHLFIVQTIDITFLWL